MPLCFGKDIHFEVCLCSAGSQCNMSCRFLNYLARIKTCILSPCAKADGAPLLARSKTPYMQHLLQLVLYVAARQVIMFLLIHICMLLPNRSCSLNGFGNSFMTFVSTLAEAHRRLLPTGPLQNVQGRLSPLPTTLQPRLQSTATGLHRSSRWRQLMAAMQSGILTSERYGLTFP